MPISEQEIKDFQQLIQGGNIEQLTQGFNQIVAQNPSQEDYMQIFSNQNFVLAQEVGLLENILGFAARIKGGQKVVRRGLGPLASKALDGGVFLERFGNFFNESYRLFGFNFALSLVRDAKVFAADWQLIFELLESKEKFLGGVKAQEENLNRLIEMVNRGENISEIALGIKELHPLLPGSNPGPAVRLAVCLIENQFLPSAACFVGKNNRFECGSEGGFPAAILLSLRHGDREEGKEKFDFLARVLWRDKVPENTLKETREHRGDAVNFLRELCVFFRKDNQKGPLLVSLIGFLIDEEVVGRERLGRLLMGEENPLLERLELRALVGEKGLNKGLELLVKFQEQEEKKVAKRWEEKLGNHSSVGSCSDSEDEMEEKKESSQQKKEDKKQEPEQKKESKQQNANSSEKKEEVAQTPVNPPSKTPVAADKKEESKSNKNEPDKKNSEKSKKSEPKQTPGSSPTPSQFAKNIVAAAAGKKGGDRSVV